MNIAFAGLRHGHIYGLAGLVKQNPDFDIAGWWEEDPEALKGGEAAFERPPYESYEALLSDANVDIVAVGDYFGIRGQRVIEALKKGKHVICDKPVCTTLEELDIIAGLLCEKNLKLGCMLDLRYEPCLQHLSSLIAQGQLGEIKTASFTGQHPLNWGQRAGWYFEEGKHGGTFNDIGIHGVDAIHFLTGFPWKKTLYARQWNAFAPLAPIFMDCAQCVGELANGANVMADVSYAAPSPGGFKTPAYWRFTLWGTNGFAECRVNDPDITLLLTGDTQPRIVTAPPVRNDYLQDFKRELCGERVRFDTQSVLDSARATLQLQLYADQKG